MWEIAVNVLEPWHPGPREVELIKDVDRQDCGDSSLLPCSSQPLPREGGNCCPSVHQSGLSLKSAEITRGPQAPRARASKGHLQRQAR